MKKNWMQKTKKDGKFRRLWSALLAAVMVLSLLPALTALDVHAASNPYPQTQDVDGDGYSEIPCTWYAWQQTHDRLGIALPNWGNAINWYTGASNSGYRTGTQAAANSIAVWRIDSHSYGHVAFVTSVDGSYMYVNEGGRTDLDSTASKGVKEQQRLPSTAGTTWYGRTLVGFVYLNAAPSVSATFVKNERFSVGDTNAVVATRLTLSGAVMTQLSRFGVYLYDAAGNQVTCIDEPANISKNYNYLDIWYDINTELHYMLTRGTSYTYKFFCVIGGTTYWSDEWSFKTTGSASVESVTLDRRSVSLNVGESTTLTATVSPSDATDKNVTWSSSNTSVATVSGGNIVAIAAGTATITATAGGKSASCTVTVKAAVVPVNAVALDRTSLALIEGGSASLTASVSPSDATDKNVTWRSSNPSVATVSGGNIAAVSAGTATITATAGGKSASCTVTVEAAVIPVTHVALNTTALTISEGDSAELSAFVNPSDATDRIISWTSDNTSVATVSSGTVTAVSIGTATITATAGGKSASCTVTVTAKEQPVVGVTLDRQSVLMNVGESTSITYTVLPMGAADQTVRVSSSNRNVADVTVGGNTIQVQAKTVGASTVTVTTTDGGYSATCKVTVTDNDPTDVDKSAWYYDAVKYVMDKGIMSGYGSGLFGPNDNLSRAMVVQVLYNTEGKPATSGGNQFSDVPSGQWFTDAVRWAANKKIVSGFGGGLFKPNDSLTVEQLAVILYNYSGSPAVSGSPYGVGKYSDWAANALRWAKTQGILTNVPFTDASEPGTRAQTAQMLMNFLK